MAFFILWTFYSIRKETENEPELPPNMTSYEDACAPVQTRRAEHYNSRSTSSKNGPRIQTGRSRDRRPSLRKLEEFTFAFLSEKATSSLQCRFPAAVEEGRPRRPGEWLPESMSGTSPSSACSRSAFCPSHDAQMHGRATRVPSLPRPRAVAVIDRPRKRASKGRMWPRKPVSEIQVHRASTEKADPGARPPRADFLQRGAFERIDQVRGRPKTRSGRPG